MRDRSSRTAGDEAPLGRGRGAAFARAGAVSLAAIIAALAGCTLDAMGEGTAAPGAADAGGDAIIEPPDGNADALADAAQEADASDGGQANAEAALPDDALQPDAQDAISDKAETTPEPADHCPGVVVALAGGGSGPRTGSVTGTTAGKSNDLQGAGACGSAPGADAVYWFQPDIEGVATLQLTAQGADAMLYVRHDCSAPSSQAACAETAGTNAETVVFGVKSGATYYAIVDGADAAGAFVFDLSLSIQPAFLPEACPGEPVVWTGSGTDDRTATVTGTTAAATNDETSSCAVPAAKEHVYELSADTDGILRLHLAPMGWNAVLSVRTSCTVPGTEQICENHGATGASEDVELWVTAGSAYYVLVV